MPPKKQSESAPAKAPKKVVKTPKKVTKPVAESSNSSSNSEASDSDNSESSAVKTPSKSTKVTKTKGKVEQTPVKTSTVKRARTVIDLRQLSTGGDDPVQIDVSYDSSTTAKLVKGTFTSTLKLESSAKFSLVRTVMATDDEYKGCQLIILRPASAFPFMKLPAECRHMVYEAYFAAKGIIGNPVVIEGKRKGNGDVYAKAYANGEEYRVALLAASKTINAEAAPVFYHQGVKVESPAALISFLSLLDEESKSSLRRVEIQKYGKAARIATGLLAASCHRLERLHFEQEVTNNEPKKAAKMFMAEMQKPLELMGTAMVYNGILGHKRKVLDILSFGNDALQHKGESYEAMELLEFYAQMRDLINESVDSGWTCICGERAGGHRCKVPELGRTEAWSPSYNQWKKVLSQIDQLA